MRLRLRAIKYGCDFRKAETSLYDDFKRDRKYKQVGDIKEGEVILFVSCHENQMIWLFAAPQVEGHRGKSVTVVDSRRWRILGGKWNPAMLGNYARMVGIDLVGIRLFEFAYKAERAERHKVKTLDDYVYQSHTHIAAIF